MNFQGTQLIPQNNVFPAWRSKFKTKSQMDSSPMKFPISGFLPEGITFIGGLSGSGKTWFGLSMAKAVCTGEDFLGKFAVNERSNVLYLVPESGERAFRDRMEIIGIPDDENFLCRTMSDGPMDLGDEDLESAIIDLKPVVFLDTLIRFSDTDNENDASQSARVLAKAIFKLIRMGAKAVVCLHHSPKGSGNQPPTLENTLRGSGDLGAMADAVYSLRIQDSQTLRVRVQSVKTRDFEPTKPFEIQGGPYLDDTGDFSLITDSSPLPKNPGNLDRSRKEELFLSAIRENPMATYSQLMTALGVSRRSIQTAAQKLGWRKKEGEAWVSEIAKSAGHPAAA